MRAHSRRLAALAGAAGTAGEAARAGIEGLVAGLGRCSAPGARSYDATFGRLLVGLYGAMADDLSRCAPGPGSGPRRVVDVGAGPGGLVVALARVLPDDRLTTVDIDPEMVALARNRVERAGLAARVTTLVGDVGSLPMPDGCADLVTSSFSVHHWPDPVAGFAEIRRVLRPGGRVVVFDLPDWWGRFETSAPPLLAAARQGGFDAATAGRFAWPGPVPVLQRIEATR